MVSKSCLFFVEAVKLKKEADDENIDSDVKQRKLKEAYEKLVCGAHEHNLAAEFMLAQFFKSGIGCQKSEKAEKGWMTDATAHINQGIQNGGEQLFQYAFLLYYLIYDTYNALRYLNRLAQEGYPEAEKYFTKFFEEHIKRTIDAKGKEVGEKVREFYERKFLVEKKESKEEPSKLFPHY